MIFDRAWRALLYEGNAYVYGLTNWIRFYTVFEPLDSSGLLASIDNSYNQNILITLPIICDQT